MRPKPSRKCHFTMADPVHIRPGIKRRWCPTQVDESGNYIVGQWAYCSDNCPDTNDITKKGRVNSRVKKGLNLLIHLHRSFFWTTSFKIQCSA